MSYVKGALSKVYDELESGITFWLYYTSDPIGTVLGSGYIADATDRRVKLGDVVDVFVGTLSNFAALTGGNTLGAANFPPTVGVFSRFTAAPVWYRCGVSAVTAPTTTTPGAASLQQIELPASAFGSNPRNLFDGGDATINPWQRGTSITGIVATNTYTADRWFMVAGAASSASMVKTADTSILGFSQAFVWGRASGQSSVSAIVLGQVLETLDSVRLQGQPLTLSFWAKAMSGYTGGSLAVRVGQGTGTDQSASSFVNTSWTAYSDVISTTQVLTANYQRYVFSGTVGNTATQVGASFAFTPVGTNTGNDAISMIGIQLEQGGLSPFEHRDVQFELELCQRYFVQLNETSTSIAATGAVEAANATTFVIDLPTQMRTAPTVTVVAGSFAQQVSGTTAAVSGFAAGSTHTPNFVTVVSTTTATSGLAALLLSRQTNSGSIAISADL